MVGGEFGSGSWSWKEEILRERDVKNRTPVFSEALIVTLSVFIKLPLSSNSLAVMTVSQVTVGMTFLPTAMAKVECRPSTKKAWNLRVLVPRLLYWMGKDAGQS